MAAVPPPNAAASYALDAPTEAHLTALLSKTAGQDVSAVLRQARAAAQVPPGPLSLDALERVARAIVEIGAFPTTVSARSFIIRIGSYRTLARRSAPPSTTARLTVA